MLACVPRNTYLRVVARFVCESLNVNMSLCARGLHVCTAHAGSGCKGVQDCSSPKKRHSQL